MEETEKSLQKSIYEEFTTLIRAMGHPIRLEVLDLLSQRDRTVEELAHAIGTSHANLSHHLQNLKRARLLEMTRKGREHTYRIAKPQVIEAWEAIRRLGLAQNAEAMRLFNELHSVDHPYALGPDQLKEKLAKEELVLVDVRPKEEYKAGHIASALSIPEEELEKELHRLPKDQEIVAYCRGPFCVMSDKAVALLREKGYQVSSYQDGFSGWIEKGYAVERNPNEQKKTDEA